MGKDKFFRFLFWIFETRVFVAIFLKIKMQYGLPFASSESTQAVHSFMPELPEVAPPPGAMMTSSLADRVTSAEVLCPSAIVDSVDELTSGDREPVSASNGFSAYIFIHTRAHAYVAKVVALCTTITSSSAIAESCLLYTSPSPRD